LYKPGILAIAERRSGMITGGIHGLSSSSGNDNDVELEGMIRPSEDDKDHIGQPLEDDKDSSSTVNDVEAMMGSFKVCLMPLYWHVLMC
jgi:hypothetical protein